MSDYDPLLKPKYYDQPDLSHDLCRGLVGWWMLNDEGGLTAHDISGKGNHGTLVNGPTWQGGALDFPGTDEYVDLGINAYNLGIRRNATFAAWVKFDWLLSLYATIISDYASSKGMSLRGQQIDQLEMYVYPDDYRITVDNIVAKGIWYHVMGVMDGSYVRLYLNGEEIGTPVALSGDIGDSASTLKIGSRGDLQDYCNGPIDDVRIYNRALSEAEAGELHRNTLSGEYAEFPRLDVTKYFIPTGAAYRQRIISIS